MLSDWIHLYMPFDYGLWILIICMSYWVVELFACRIYTSWYKAIMAFEAYVTKCYRVSSYLVFQMNQRHFPKSMSVWVSVNPPVYLMTCKTNLKINRPWLIANQSVTLATETPRLTFLVHNGFFLSRVIVCLLGTQYMSKRSCIINAYVHEKMTVLKLRAFKYINYVGYFVLKTYPGL